MASFPGQTVAGLPLLATKCHVPTRRSGLVSRPRLIDRLDEGAERRVTLVSAPAGSGKTTLLAEWLAVSPAGGRPAAWVSLDPGDNDPALFWAYVITALQTLRSGVGRNALALLRSPQPPPIEAVLTALINELVAVADDFVLVLDDFHAIDVRPVHDAVAFLLDHLPPQMHLVIATREDPPLPLPRLRARGQLTELRAADLRFTPSEAAEFLNGLMGLGLSAADVAALETRTEGWIAGLQLAALSLRGRVDARGFVRDFAGDDRYILDYLVEEVLRRQPERAQNFLLQTSVLDRLCGPLCDAVTDRADGQGMLEALERGNLFVVPLDDRRRWYRYHHLFADVLRARAAQEQPDEVAVWHRRASAWYEANGERDAAVRHALAAGDSARAADLVEPAALAMLGTSQDETLHGWLAALPDEVVRARPVLSVYYAFAALGRGGLDAAEGRLRDAERWLDVAGDVDEPGDARLGGMVVADDEGFRALRGTIAVARAYRAGALGDVPGTVAYARRALDLLPEDDFWRGAAASILGIAYWSGGELEAAHHHVADAMARLYRAGYVHFRISLARILADIRIAQGRLREAERIYEQALRMATEDGDPVWGTADLYVGLSELHRERGDLDTATQLLLRSKELGEHAGLLDTRHRWYVAMARIKEAQGDLDAALTVLDEAARLYVGGPDPEARPVAALKAQVLVAQGQLADALVWARERGLSVDDDLSYAREFEHMTLARVLIARHQSGQDDRAINEALRLLARLLSAADAGGRTGSVVEILVLMALAHAARSDVPQALAPLERALTLAAPEGCLRIFVGEGAPMRDLLRHAAAKGITTAYAQRLLSACDEPAWRALAPDQATTAGLAEPLTAREIEVLRLIAAGMRNREIADHLFVSLATVKRHIANAYGKLGARHRTEALARANALNLL